MSAKGIHILAWLAGTTGFEGPHTGCGLYVNGYARLPIARKVEHVSCQGCKAAIVAYALSGRHMDRTTHRRSKRLVRRPILNWDLTPGVDEVPF